LVALEEERNALLRELVARTLPNDFRAERLIELEEEVLNLLRHIIRQLPDMTIDIRPPENGKGERAELPLEASPPTA
jgi:hypothetical protein